MGIVVCVVMLLGLVILRPIPWSSAEATSLEPKFVFTVVISLGAIGCWNLIYGYLKIDGFWHVASIVSGLAMILASALVLREKNSPAKNGPFRNTVVALLAVSFLVYAVTLIQLNLGYPILR